MIGKLSNSSLLSKAYSKSMLVGNPTYVPPSYELIETITATGSQATITFSSIPQTYKHIEVRYSARGLNTVTGMALRVNGSSSAIYSQHELRSNGSATSSGFYGSSQTKIDFSITTSSSDSGAFSSGVVSFADYASSLKYKTMRALSGYTFSAPGQGQVALFSGLFMSTSSIDSLSFLYNLGTSNFESGSKWSLYGIKG